MIKTSLDFNSVSSLQVSFTLAKENDDRMSKEILITAFSGIYRDASEGNSDADFMYAMIQSGITLWHPDGIVIDLSNLVYNSGDWIEKALTAPSEMIEQVPSTIVVGPRCKQALTSLFRYDGDDLVDDYYFFEDKEKAIKYLIDFELA